MRRQLILAVLVAVLPACRQIHSKDVKTGQMQAQFTVVQEGSGCDGDVFVDGKLSTELDGGSTGIELTDGEKLTVLLEGDEKPMDDADENSYSTKVSTDVSGIEVFVTFHRSGSPSASRSHVEMPDNFDIDRPSAGDSQSRGSSLVVHWNSPSSEPMGWLAEGNCIESASGITGKDRTSFTIPAHGLSGSGSCTVTLTLERSQSGTVDPAFAGGQITAIQRRRASFLSTP